MQDDAQLNPAKLPQAANLIDHHQCAEYGAVPNETMELQ